MSTIKVTNITPQSGTDVYLTGSLTVTEVLTARELRTELTQSVVLFQSGSTKFGDTSDDNHTFTGSLLINGSTTQIGQINVSGITGSVKATNGVVSSSAQIQDLGFASDAELNASSSALTTAYTSADTSLSSSLVTTIDSVSSSLAADLTTEANNVDALQTDSGSFSTRVTSLESFSSSLDNTYATDAEVSTAVSSLNLATGSYATTGSNTFVDNQIISGTIDATGATSKVRFLYATTGDLPAAADYHGMFAHVHAEGAAYYAHGGNWVELANSSSFASEITSLTEETGSYASTGSNTFTGDQIVSSSVLLTLQPSPTTPSGVATGSLIVSGSPVQLYIYNGSGSSGWNRV